MVPAPGRRLDLRSIAIPAVSDRSDLSWTDPGTSTPVAAWLVKESRPFNMAALCTGRPAAGQTPALVDEPGPGRHHPRRASGIVREIKRGDRSLVEKQRSGHVTVRAKPSRFTPLEGTQLSRRAPALAKRVRREGAGPGAEGKPRRRYCRPPPWQFRPVPATTCA
jgi:hypothetical protein